MLKVLALGLMVAVGLAATACTHVAGVVRQPNGQPLATAVFSIGRPGAVIFGTHNVDANGHFDFFMGPEDDTNLYLYDGAARAELTLQKIERTSINDRMIIRMYPANADPDAIVAPQN